MGMFDTFASEGMVTVKLSTLYDVMKTCASAELIKNAVKCDVPHIYIREMLTGVHEDLPNVYMGELVAKQEETVAEPAHKPAETPTEPITEPAPTTEAPKPKATVKRRIPQETIDKIVELTNKGDSVDDIALKAGVSGPTVRKYQKEVMDCEE